MAAALEFYFYTNEIALAEIRLFGYIKTVPLLGMDSAYGEGVYGTLLPPSRAQEVVSLNDWGSYWKLHNQDVQQVDRALRLLITAQELVTAPSSPCILIHLGPIELSRYQWQLCMMPELNSLDPEPQEGYIELEEDSSDDGDDNNEEAQIQSGEIFCEEEEEDAGGNTDSSDSTEETTESECESWPAGGMCGDEQLFAMDPYTAGMMYGFGLEVYEEESASDDEDW